jgi:CHAT domain-containing protein
LPSPLLYHDPEKELLFLAVPPHTTREEDERAARTLFGELLVALPSAQRAAPYLDVARIQHIPGLGGLALALRLVERGEEVTPERLREATMEEMLQVLEASPLLQALWAFITAETWAESKRIVEENSELLTEEADSLLGLLISMWEDEDAIRILKEHRELLRRCREVGIERAFAEKMRPEIPPLLDALQALLAEINNLTRRQDMPRRVELCRRALRMVRREENPQLWAALQGELGNSLWRNPLGDRAENLERAIEAYTAALEVYTRADFPVDWAMTQNNLGYAYRNRIRGDSAENIELAIEAYKRALKVYTRDDFPVQWAMTQNNLGAAYSDRIRGERAENLERAIKAYIAALEVYTRADFPVQWAGTQNNLGAAYRNRIRGDSAENIELAIEAYKRALEVYTRDDFPVQWAMTQNNLGIAYSDRIRGDSAENIELAIEAYKRALKVYTRYDFPVQWATTQNNLGIAYSDRIRGDSAENIELAIEAYKRALEVRTRDDFPVDWAMTQNNLGAAYRDAGRFDEAISCFEGAIEEYRLGGIREEERRVCNNLGNLYYKKLKDWSKARQVYMWAVEAIETMRTEALSLEERRRLIAENFRTFDRLALSCIKSGRKAEALRWLERAKTRNLIEMMARTEIRPDPNKVPQRLLSEYERLLSEDIRLQMELERLARPPMGLEAVPEEVREAQESAWRESRRRVREESSRVREALKGVERRIAALDPDFAPAIEPLDFQSICSLVPTDIPTAIVEFQVTEDEGTRAFVVLGEGGLHIVHIPDFGLGELRRLLVEFDGEGEPVGGWLVKYDAHRSRGTRATKKEWHREIERVTGALYEELLAPLDSHLKRLGIRRIIFIPHRYLHILPLHAAWREENGERRYLLDDYEITYAPSATVLARCVARVKEGRGRENFFAVANPKRDLIFTDDEVRNVERLFKERRVLWYEECEVDAVLAEAPGYHFVHFSCHGGFNPADPLYSALGLADRKLTLREIFERVRLPEARLVVMSACETSLVEIRELAEEFVGLPAGFLQAGSPAVVSSLWAVDDMATSLLIRRLYGNIVERGMEVAEALREAQGWLRNVTVGEIRPDLERIREQLEVELEREKGMRRIKLRIQGARLKAHSDEPDDYRPFTHPYWWAAFQAFGV